MKARRASIWQRCDCRQNRAPSRDNRQRICRRAWPPGQAAIGGLTIVDFDGLPVLPPFTAGRRRMLLATLRSSNIGHPRNEGVPRAASEGSMEREIMLAEITREHLVAAPVIERTHFTARAVIEPAVIQPAFAHFKIDISHRSNEATRPEGRSASPPVTANCGANRKLSRAIRPLRARPSSGGSWPGREARFQGAKHSRRHPALCDSDEMTVRPGKSSSPQAGLGWRECRD